MADLLHDFYMAETGSNIDPGPEDASSWDRRLTTEQVIERIKQQLPAEDDGDGLTIMVTTYFDSPEFGDIELSPFTTDADGGFPLDTNYLYELSDGQLFEDSQGYLFNRVGHGPVQGSVEIVDDEEIHAYFDVTTRVRIHGKESN